MTLIYPCFGLCVFAAICAYAFGPKRGAGIVLVAIFLVGTVLSFAAPDTFQTYLMLVGYGGALVMLASWVGLAAGAQLRKKKYWLMALVLLTFPYLIWSTQDDGSRKAEEAALDFSLSRTTSR